MTETPTTPTTEIEAVSLYNLIQDSEIQKLVWILRDLQLFPHTHTHSLTNKRDLKFCEGKFSQK
jgi:hypothetical protein